MYEPIYKLTRTSESTIPQIVKMINKEYVEKQTIFGMNEKCYKVFSEKSKLSIVVE